MKKDLMVGLVILSTSFCNAQNKINSKIISALIKADSVILISHILTEEYAAVSPSDTKKIFFPFLVHENINPKIIIGRALLYPASLEEMIRIIGRPVKNTEWVSANCDEPHNSILFYRKGRLSYFDICFGCHRIHASKDFEYKGLAQIIMDEKKWNDLKIFFKKVRVNYTGPN